MPASLTGLNSEALYASLRTELLELIESWSETSGDWSDHLIVKESNEAYGTIE
jgi:hypothetical protein